MKTSNVIVSGGVCAGVLTAFFTLRALKRYLFRSLQPYIPVGVVSELYIYPIKSSRGKEVVSIECGLLGAQSNEVKDRQFLVVREDTKRFLTAVVYPKMVLLEADVHNGILQIQYPGQPSCAVQISDVIKSNNVVTANMYGRSKQDALDCGDEVGKWLKAALGTEENLRLLYYPDERSYERYCEKASDIPVSDLPEKKVRFNDLAPFLVFGSGSVADLRSHFDVNDNINVLSKNFRPNIVVDHCAPFAEDWWMNVRIGEAEFEYMRPCTRCVLITVDPCTGTRNKELQPLKELRRYRRAPGELEKIYKDSPVFGAYLYATKPGKIQIGDVVYAQHKDHPL
ncbi:hypothetical protein AB6A40_002838 [Gnathostoma spinigerum]|uniref:MOSC domain-containing protein n=1 Tax=Gnathostoma spinigerum TaxID=75299 RepID=A0ABD6EFK8_9BILA